MLNSHFKLGIIGGGIIGTYAAYLASKKGINVELFERTPKKIWLNDPLITRRCGEGIWKTKLEKAAIELSLNSPPKYLENFTTTLLLGRLQQNKLTFLKGKIDHYLFINRQLVEKYFYQQSKQKGSIWHFGKNINNFPNWEKKNNFNLILGAWGTNPNLTNQVVKDKYHQEFVLTRQHTFINVNSLKIGNAKTIILTDDPTIRYFYIFPKGKGNSVEANIGIGFNELNIKNPFSKLNQLLQLNPLGALTKAKYQPGRSFFKILCSGPPVVKDNLLSNNLLLAGDAGFNTNAVSGGGIGFGLWAAKKAIESCYSQNPQKEFYERLKPLTENLKKTYRISKKLYIKNTKERKKINDYFFASTKEVIKTGGFLSLGKIAKEILAN